MGWQIRYGRAKLERGMRMDASRVGRTRVVERTNNEVDGLIRNGQTQRPEADKQGREVKD